MSSPDFDANSGSQAAQNLLLEGQNSAVSFGSQNWRECFPEIIGRSGRMLAILETVSKIARTDSAVLVLGESGTGKDVIASAIHRLSPRSAKRFIPLNCSAIPENLLESELFGHERGAFTGAIVTQRGKFDLASGGTIFLDEIGDMPMSLQSKLLRVLQEKRFTPLGSAETRNADVRIIAATNKDLELAVKDGTFRKDLYYRINVLPIHVPSLRERREDVAPLLEHFLDLNNRTLGGQESCFFSERALNTLIDYDWPGNVRQLINLVERLVVLRGGGLIDLEHMPQEIFLKVQADEFSVAAPPSQFFEAKGPLGKTMRLPGNFTELPLDGIDLIRFIEELENSYILQALERTNNNKNQAAKLLGLNRTTLVERIKKRKIGPLNSPSKEL